MFDGVDPGRLAFVVAVCVGMAALGTLLAGNALKTWYPTLVKPWFQIPLPLFIGIGLVGYVLDAVILYRLGGLLGTESLVAIAIVAMLVVMLYNELWNAALFRLRSPFAAWIGLLGFLAPLTILEASLIPVDAVSAVIMGGYMVWVLAYDVPWAYALWRRNPEA